MSNCNKKATYREQQVLGERGIIFLLWGHTFPQRRAVVE